MKNNAIEDILIDKNFDRKNKKGKGIIIVFVILMILLLLAVGAYCFININKETSQELFLKGILNTDLSFFTENETYKAIAQKFASNSFEMDNELTFSTTMKSEELEETQDFSKYLLNLTTINNIQNEESYNELNLSYADNKLLNVKMINNKEKWAIISDEIVNKYVGIQKSNANVFFERLGMGEIVTQYEEIKKQIVIEQIDLDEETKKQKKDEYMNLLLSKLGEEKFTSQDNQISLEKENAETVTVNAYKLSLTQEEYYVVIKDLLTTLKNDKELIQRFVTNVSINEDTIDVEESNESKNENINDIEVSDEVVNGQQEEIESQENMNIVTIPNLDPIGVEPDFEASLNENEIDYEDETILQNQTEDLANLSPPPSQSSYAEKRLASTIITLLQIQSNMVINPTFGFKMNISIEDVEELIDSVIESIEKLEENSEGNDFEMTVYVSELQTEKISISFPNKETIDIEFDSTSENEKKLVMTYLYEEKSMIEDSKVTVYSAAENTIPQDSLTETKTNGVKVEISKSQNDASTTIKTVYNIIKDKKIDQKVSIDTTTKGTASSKNFNNECIITHSNNDGEIKANIKNKINFDKVSEIEKLTEENCLFLDSLTDEELAVTMQEIETQIEKVYTNKKESLNLIDTNTQAPDISQNNVNRDELRNLLVTTVSIQMGEAQARGEEYTLQNLIDLQISGHMVSVVIQNDVAEVSVDGVKFKIDANFNLLDA